MTSEMTPEQKAVEQEALLDHYRLRYHHQVQNAAYCSRIIKEREQDIEELKKQLKAAAAREQKLLQTNDELRNQLDWSDPARMP